MTKRQSEAEENASKKARLVENWLPEFDGVEEKIMRSKILADCILISEHERFLRNVVAPVSMKTPQSQTSVTLDFIDGSFRFHNEVELSISILDWPKRKFTLDALGSLVRAIRPEKQLDLLKRIHPVLQAKMITFGYIRQIVSEHIEDFKNRACIRIGAERSYRFATRNVRFPVNELRWPSNKICECNFDQWIQWSKSMNEFIKWSRMGIEKKNN